MTGSIKVRRIHEDFTTMYNVPIMLDPLLHEFVGLTSVVANFLPPGIDAVQFVMASVHMNYAVGVFGFGCSLLLGDLNFVFGICKVQPSSVWSISNFVELGYELFISTVFWHPTGEDWVKLAASGYCFCNGVAAATSDKVVFREMLMRRLYVDEKGQKTRKGEREKDDIFSKFGVWRMDNGGHKVN